MEFNILFSSTGRRVSLIRSFKKTLLDMGLPGKIITADMQKNAAASFVGDVKELVPRVTDPSYIDTLKEICFQHKVQLLIPLIDTELPILAAHKAEFAKMGVTVLVCSQEVNQICFDKRETYQFFKRIGVQTPEIYDLANLCIEDDTIYPIFLKPATGSSSIGATIIKNYKELVFFKDYVNNSIIQRLVTGQEYTLDVLVDFSGMVKCVVPRLRMETRAGEISKGMTVKNYDLIHAGKAVVEALPGAVGCITVQCFLQSDGQISFIEINPRFGGGIPLSLKSGADFPRWIIHMLLGNAQDIELAGWLDGLVMLRYDDEIFVSKDETQ